ncbi:MAG: hypothetical protein SH859_01890 [Hyphomicrobium aestuarii]|nr:hypothetical protein [Hyphomicrobium aestuarii]
MILVRSDPEHAYYAWLVSNTNLDVRFVTEAGILIQRRPFLKKANDSVDRGFAPILAHCVENPDDGTVEFSEEQVFAAGIFRQLCTALCLQCEERAMRLAHLGYSCFGCQVQAETEINDRAYDCNWPVCAVPQPFFFGES